jgi:DNA-binding transcriptional regulator YiaG
MTSVEERFWSKVDKTEECWLWKGGLEKNGYGRFSIGKKRVGIHRLSLEWSLGRPIGDGMVARHKCRNCHCVRPEHLEEGTHTENMNDKFRDETMYCGEQHHKCKLTEEQVRAIRTDSRSQKELAEIYGISRRSINNIKNYKSWGWLH